MTILFSRALSMMLCTEQIALDLFLISSFDITQIIIIKFFRKYCLCQNFK